MSRERQVFDATRDVRCGAGWVPFALATQDRNGRHRPEGWVLPGGTRTASPEIARAVAYGIDKLINPRAGTAASAN